MRATADSWFPEQSAGHARGALVGGPRPRLRAIGVPYPPALSDLPCNRCLNRRDDDLQVDDSQWILAGSAAATRVSHPSHAEHSCIRASDRAGVERHLTRRPPSISQPRLFILSATVRPLWASWFWRSDRRVFGKMLKLRVEPGVEVAEKSYHAHTRLGVHHHVAPSLSLIFQGWHDERLGRHLYRCDPLSVTYKRGGIDHSNYMGCDGLHGVFVELSPDTVAELESPTARRDFLLIGSPRSRRLVRYIARESALQPPGFELALGSLLAELLAEVCRFATPHSFGRPSWLERAREYVEAHSSMRITLAEIARHAGVHPVHLAQAFRSRYGMSVGAYVRRVRVERARQQLATDRSTISQVALSAGFTDQSHLTRVFQMHTGTTPGRFRRAIAAAHAVTPHPNPVQDGGSSSR